MRAFLLVMERDAEMQSSCKDAISPPGMSDLFTSPSSVSYKLPPKGEAGSTLVISAMWVSVCVNVCVCEPRHWGKIMTA